MCKHKIIFTHMNGVKECIECYTLFVRDTPEMRDVYGYSQFEVIWEKEEVCLEKFGKSS